MFPTSWVSKFAAPGSWAPLPRARPGNYTQRPGGGAADKQMQSDGRWASGGWRAARDPGLPLMVRVIIMTVQDS